MRNLKRALSLGLTAAMISGLMVMGSSAAGYNDSESIQNQTAVEILGEIGAMVGDDKGNFNPDQDVTRAEMAVIITRVLYGNNLDVSQFEGMNIFSDVPSWAEGFVNLCASLDIVAGVGDGKFAPNETVTVAQASLMLSRALGYFQNNAEFGNDWALAAVRRATTAGIIGGNMVLQANEGLSRDDVAQMTFNTLTKAVPVQYNDLLDVYYNENQGITYALTFNYLQTLGYTNFSLVYDNGDTTVYGRPATTWGIGTYRTTTTDKDSGSRYDESLDADGGLISSNVQILSKDEIITIPNEPTYVYTDGMKQDDVYDDLGAAVCNNQRGEDEYTWTVYVNGEQVFEGEDSSKYIPANKNVDYTVTGEGAQTEIYVDDADKTVTVVEINYYLGQVASVREGDDGQYVTIRTVSDLAGAKLDDRTFAGDFAKDDYVVFTIDQDADDDFYICEMTAPETVDGTVTRVNKNSDSDNSYLYLDRENKYNYSDHMAYDLNDETVVRHPSLEENYTLYLDPLGYVLAYSGDTTKSFLYVQDSDEELADWEARVVLGDGTNDVILVNDDLDNAEDTAIAKNSGYPGYDDDIDWLSFDGEGAFDDFKNNMFGGNGYWPDEDELKPEWSDARSKISEIDYQIWEYEANADGELYTLTGRETRYEADVKINNGEAYIESPLHHDNILIDSSTVFVDVESGAVYTGYDEVPDVSNAYIAYVLEDDNDRDVAEIVYIIDGNIYDADAIFFVITSDERDTEKYDGDYYFEFEDMYVDGHHQSGLYVSYDALIKAGLTPSLDNDDQDADRDASTDAEIENNMVGEVFKVLKSEDGTYITEIEHWDTWNWAETATNSALWVYYTGMNGSDKYKTNSDTTYVIVEEQYEYDRNGDPIALEKYDVSEGGYGDIIKYADRNDKDNDGYITKVQVMKAEDGTANLVYIWKFIPEFYEHDIIINVDGTQKDALDITNEFAELVNLAPYVSDKVGHSYTYSVSNDVDANGEPIVYEAPSNNMVQVDTRDVEEDILINITTIFNSVYNGNAILTVEYTDLNKADLDPARDDAIPQYVDALGANYRFMLDLTRLTETEIASWNETVYINDVLMYGDLPKSGTVNLTAPNTGMVQGVTSLADMGLKINAGDKVEIIVTNIALDNEPAPEPAPDTYTLTLNGADFANAKVWTDNNGEYTEIGQTNETPFGRESEIPYEAPIARAANTGVKVIVSGISTEVASGEYISGVDGTIVTVDKENGTLTFTMEDDLTLNGVPDEKAYTVKVDGEFYQYISATNNVIKGLEPGDYLYDNAVTSDKARTVAANGEMEINSLRDIDLYTAYQVTLNGIAGVVLGDGSTPVKTYVAAGQEILLGKDTYMVNGEMRTFGDGESLTVNGQIVVDKVAENSSELASAIAAGKEETIYLTDSTYVLDSTQKVSSSITIKGVDGSKIAVSDVAFNLDGDADLTVSDVTFICTDDKMVIKNANITDSGKINLDGCVFEGGRFGIYLDGLTGGSITNCTFNGMSKAAIGLGSSLAGDIVISGNTYNVTGSAVAIEYVTDIVNYIKGTDFASLSDDLKSEL